MIKQTSRRSRLHSEPAYAVLWQGIKLFPKGLAAGASKSPGVDGPAAAALLSAGFGCFLMMVSHHLGDTSKVREQFIWMLGSWIPGSHNASKLYGEIGSYSGKETVLLLGWLMSWFVLHQLWRRRNIPSTVLFLGMFSFFVAATVMSWHPLFPYLPLMKTP